MLSDETTTGPLTDGELKRVDGIFMPDEHLEGKVLVGKNAKYPLVQMISKGGTAVVYLAAMQPLKKSHADAGKRDTMVAVKILRDSRLQTDPAHVERFKREADIMSRINHPNIVKLYDFAYYENMPFLVTEYIPGESLRDRISRYNNPGKPDLRLEMDYIGWVSQEICAGLGAVHAAGLIFADMKPDNVLCLGDTPIMPSLLTPVSKIIDFGGARPSDPLAKRFTFNGDVYGTIKYMAPEKMNGNDYDKRVDIYSTGIVIYEMLAGKTPFDAKTVGALVRDIAITKPPSLRTVAAGRDIPETICRVIEKSLEKNPDDRFESIDAFRAAISDAWKGGDPVPIRRPKGRRRIWAIAAAAGALVAIGFSAYLMKGKDIAHEIWGHPAETAAVNAVEPAPIPPIADTSRDSLLAAPKNDSAKTKLLDSSNMSDTLEPRIKAPKKPAPSPSLIKPNPRYKANRN